MTYPLDSRGQAAVAEARHEAQETARVIGALRPRLTALVAEVVGVVGGSAQRVDRDMVAALRAAERELGRAEFLLHDCGGRAARLLGRA